MSRGATQYIIENSSLGFTDAGLNAACPLSQYLDICFVKTEVTNADITAGSYIAQTQNDKGRVFQKNADNLTWTELGLGFLDRGTIYVDENIVSNVTPLRKAHMEDVRTFSKFIEEVYAKRYGDTYFNSHIFTKAQLLWKDALGLGRIYLQDLADGQKNLCIEFGESSDGNFGGSKLQMAYRAAGDTDAPATILQVFAQGYKCLEHGWVVKNKLVGGNCGTNGVFISVGNTFHLGIGSPFATAINVASGAFRALEKRSSRLHVNSYADFSDGVIIETLANSDHDKSDVQHKVSGTNYSIWDERNLHPRPASRSHGGVVTTTPVHLDPLAVDADKVDGKHTIDRVLASAAPNNVILNAIPLISLEASIGGGKMGENPNMGLNADTLDGWHYAEILATVKTVTASSTSTVTQSDGEVTIPEGITKFQCSVLGSGGGWILAIEDGLLQDAYGGAVANALSNHTLPVKAKDKISWTIGGGGQWAWWSNSVLQYTVNGGSATYVYYHEWDDTATPPALKAPVTAITIPGGGYVKAGQGISLVLYGTVGSPSYTLGTGGTSIATYGAQAFNRTALGVGSLAAQSSDGMYSFRYPTVFPEQPTSNVAARPQQPGLLVYYLKA